MARQGGFGAVVKIDVGTVATAIAYLLDVKMPEHEKVLWEATGHDSTGGYEEQLSSGVRKLSEMTLTLAWDVAEDTHAALVTGYESDDAVNMSVEDPGGTEVVAFSAQVVKLGRVSELKGGYKCDVTIQPTGQPTIT